MAPHIPQMRENIARVLGLEVDQVNIKATTEEGLGFTGTGEGISSQAICAIEKITNLASVTVADESGVKCTSCTGCSKR